jgi:cytosine deaminase
MGLHVAQMTSAAGKRAAFDAVTAGPARILHLDGYCIAPGCRADCVLLQARDPIEAIRLRAARLAVIRAGRIVAETPPATATLRIDGRPAQVDWNLRAMRPS